MNLTAIVILVAGALTGTLVVAGLGWLRGD